MVKKQDATEQKKTVGITVRVDMETNRILSAILSLKGMTLSGFLQDSIRNFIKDNHEEAKKLLDMYHIESISEGKSSSDEAKN
ncbi:hypothetical protein FACS1894204_12430 [Synergistales bacterium]|nr:hypothetical protein FACS1894204_12430 [Synergistales bacterium]